MRFGRTGPAWRPEELPLSDALHCLQCGSSLPAPGEPCYHCLLAASLETPEEVSLDLDFLDDLPIPGDTRVIAGKYRIIEVIGRGSFGVVYRARQENLDRDVAVKTLRDGAFADDEERELFTREAKAVAQLNHPNVVAIYDWGEDRGQPFFSMEFVDGPSLAQRVREQPLAAAEAARIIATVARALHVVHQHGLLHRDLKPGNILMTAAGVPKISDFGLAKRTRADASVTLTLAGHLLGSPAYMSPEQATAATDGVGPASDIYGLGATLYCLLTARPPYNAQSLPETLRQVVENEPVLPRRLNPSVPRDVETICLKCLEKTATRRYPTALALAEDLERFLEGRPILARPTTAFERVLKCARRRPAQAALVAALALSVIAGTTATAIQWRKAEVKARAEAALANRILTDQADGFFLDESPGEGLARYAALVRRNPGDRLAHERLFAALANHPWPIPYASFTSVGKAEPVVSRKGTMVLCAPDGTARVWNCLRGDPASGILRMDTPIVSADFCEDGDRVLTRAKNGSIAVWNAETDQRLAGSLRQQGPLLVDARTTEPRYIAAIAESDQCTLPSTDVVAARAQRFLLDAATMPGLVAECQAAQNGAEVLVSPDRGVAAVTIFHREIVLWDVARDRQLGRLPIGLSGREEMDRKVRFSRNGRLFSAFDSQARWLGVWDVAAGTQMFGVHCSAEEVDPIVWISGDETAVFVLDFDSGVLTAKWREGLAGTWHETTAQGIMGACFNEAFDRFVTVANGLYQGSGAWRRDAAGIRLVKTWGGSFPVGISAVGDRVLCASNTGRFIWDIFREEWPPLECSGTGDGEVRMDSTGSLFSVERPNGTAIVRRVSVSSYVTVHPVLLDLCSVMGEPAVGFYGKSKAWVSTPAVVGRTTVLLAMENLAGWNAKCFPSAETVPIQKDRSGDWRLVEQGGSWRVETWRDGRVVWSSLATESGPVDTARLSSDGASLVLLLKDGVTRVINLPSGSLRCEWRAPMRRSYPYPNKSRWTEHPRIVRFADEVGIMAEEENGSIRATELQTGSRLGAVSPPEDDPIVAWDLGLDGRYLYTCSRKGVVSRWETRTGRLCDKLDSLPEWDPSESRCRVIAGPEGALIVSPRDAFICGHGKVARLSTSSSGSGSNGVARGGWGEMEICRRAADGATFVSRIGSNRLEVLKVDFEAQIFRRILERDDVAESGFSEDGAKLALARASQKEVEVVDLDRGRSLAVGRTHFFADALAFSPDGINLALVGRQAVKSPQFLQFMTGETLEPVGPPVLLLNSREPFRTAEGVAGAWAFAGGVGIEFPKRGQSPLLLAEAAEGIAQRYIGATGAVQLLPPDALDRLRARLADAPADDPDVQLVRRLFSPEAAETAPVGTLIEPASAIMAPTEKP